MIQAVIERCAGIDVGKTFLVVCVMTGALPEEPQVECRKFGTIVPELERLREWAGTGRLYACRDGEYRFLLEASVQHTRNTSSRGAGQRL